MKKGLLSLLCCVLFVFSFSQNSPPVAKDNYVTVMSQAPIIIDVLANDYDPDGDSISIKDWNNPLHGSVDTVNGKFYYKSEYYTAEDHFRYKITDHGTPPAVSLFAWVYINILPNPDIPVCVNDTFEVTAQIPVYLDLLSNDYDPNGDDLVINYAGNNNWCDISISSDSLSVLVIPELYENYKVLSFKYSVRERNTINSFISEEANVFLIIKPNPDIPIAVNDSAHTTGGNQVTIPVLENDVDPQDEPIGISGFWQPSHGHVSLNGDSINYIPDKSYQGDDHFFYSVREKTDTNIHSQTARVTIRVDKNPRCPVGVADQASGMIYKSMVIDVMANDFDPNGDLMEIMDVDAFGWDTVVDNKIIYKSTQYDTDHRTIYYRVMKKWDPSYYSEWTPVEIDLAANPELPLAVTDFSEVSPCFSSIIDALANDIKNEADSIIITYTANSSKCSAILTQDNKVRIQPFSNSKGLDTIHYVISDLFNDTLRSTGNIIVEILDGKLYDSLTINNINAGVNCDGMLFTNITEIPGQGLKGNLSQHFTYPAGSLTNTIYNSSLWIGGIASQDSIFFAGERYRQMGADFQPGPISGLYDSAYARKYWKVWKLNRTDVDFHRNNWWKPGYQPIADIATWPGNGNVSLGEADQLAPYADYNLDGKYDPADGDYPLIRGDQAVFIIFNDDMMHLESKGYPLKVEIHAMVYGFNAPNDSALNNTVFVHYDLVNRSSRTYMDTYAGIFTDFALGNLYDDYIGSDVARASFYCYNGDDFDEDYMSYNESYFGYGEYPPAQSVTVLAGPFIDPDGMDNPAGGCDFSINGTNFENSIIDDERYGLTRFFYYSSIYLDPHEGSDYYNFMNGFWTDGTRIQFGGYMHYQDPVGPDCNFMYPGDSDTLNWGTNCAEPNSPYNQEGFYWTDSSIWNLPGSRRGLGVMGPFTFAPGRVQEIDLAFCAANGWNGPKSSIDNLKDYIDSLRARVAAGEIIVPNSSLSVSDLKQPLGSLKIYPNPASTRMMILVPESIPAGTEYLIYNVLGETVLSGRTGCDQQFALDISVLQQGFYFMKMNGISGGYSGKFIKH